MKLQQHLVEVSSRLRELEVDTLSCQTLVDLRVGVKAVIDTTALLLIEQNLEDLGAVLLGAHTLANNLDRVDEISEDGVVDCGERAGTRTLLGLRGAAAVGALGTRQDAAGSNDDDVAVGELLLELTSEAEKYISAGEVVGSLRELTAAGYGATQ